MYQSKIYLLFNSFSNKQRQTLFNLVDAGFYKLSLEEKKTLQYLNTLKKQNAAPDKKKLSNSIKKTGLSDQKLRLIISSTFKVLEKYTALIGFTESNEIQKDIYKLKYYREHNLDKLYNSKYRIINGSHDPYINSQIDYQYQIEIELENYQLESIKKRNQDLHLDKLLDLSDRAYYYQKLLFSCLALSHQSVYASEYTLHNIDIIIGHLSKGLMHDDATVQIFYHCYLMLKEPDVLKHHTDFKHLFFSKANDFSIENKKSLYIFAINYCIKKLNSGLTSFGKDGLDFYLSGIQNGMLFNNGKLSRYTYRNMAMMAIRTGDFVQAEQVTIDYEQNLRAIDKKPAYHMNMALIKYYNKDLDGALEHIIEVDFNDHLINLAAKTLQAKIYFESNQDNVLDSLLDSIDMYLIRKKVIGYHKTNYKNIIRYFKKLIRINPYNKVSVGKLRIKINEEKVLTEKKWLIQQLNKIQI